MKRMAMTAAFGLFASGCVSSAKYKESQSQLGSWQGKAQGLETQLAARQAELAGARASEAELRAKLASAEEQLASLKKSVADLQEGLEAKKGELSRKISALVGEKDDAAQLIREKSRDTRSTKVRNAALEITSKLERRGSESAVPDGAR